MIKLIIFVTFLATTFGKILQETRCQIPIGSTVDWHVYWPLAFRLNGSLYPTTTTSKGMDHILIPQNEELYLSCGPNYLRAYDRTEFMKVKCSDGGKFLTTDNKLKTAKDLKCDLRVIEEVITKVDGCPATAMSGQFGYLHPIDLSTRIVGESCYNTEEGRTLFAHIRLGPLAAGESITNELSDKKFFQKSHPSSTYRIDFLKAIRLDQLNERLREDLGTNDEDLPGYQIGKFVNLTLLSNKQLGDVRRLGWNNFAAHDDCVGHMETLKKDIAELGEHSEIDIYTGSHGVTKLPGVSGIKVAIYLNNVNKQFPIPELIWTVVKSGKKAAVIGIFNNPSAESLKMQSPCQTSKCDQISWLKNVKAAKIDEKTDVMVCCDYTEFRDSVKEIPRMSEVNEFYT